MNIQQLERSQKIYLDIKKLDAEIIEIDKVAQLIANGNAEVNLTLTVKDITPKIEQKEKVTTEDGSLQSEILTFEIGGLDLSERMSKLSHSIWGGISSKPHVSENETKLTADLSENLSFNVLAILLHDKQTKREKLINNLKKIGVTLS